MLKRSAVMEVSTLVPRLTSLIAPLFEEEAIFYEQLSDVLKSLLMGQPISDTKRRLLSVDTPFTNAISSTIAIDMTTEEETKDSGNDLPGSSGYDQLSSALSATSTSMISLEDTPTEFSIGGEDKKKQTQKMAVERSSLSLLTGMQPSPRQSKIPQGSSTA